MYTVQYNESYTIYSVQCTFYTALCTLYIVVSKVYNMYFNLHLNCTLYNNLYTVLQCTEYTKISIYCGNLQCLWSNPWPQKTPNRSQEKPKLICCKQQAIICIKNHICEQDLPQKNFIKCLNPFNGQNVITSVPLRGTTPALSSRIADGYKTLYKNKVFTNFVFTRLESRALSEQGFWRLSFFRNCRLMKPLLWCVVIVCLYVTSRKKTANVKQTEPSHWILYRMLPVLLTKWIWNNCWKTWLKKKKIRVLWSTYLSYFLSNVTTITYFVR